jgi:lipoprotein NlpD
VLFYCCVCITQLLDGCASTPPPDRRETYVVQPKDTLYSIAWRHDVDFRDLAKWNNIGPDYRLSVGQVLLLSGPTPAAVARPPAASHAPKLPRVAKPKSPVDGRGGTAVAGGGPGAAAGSGAAVRPGAAAGSGAVAGSGAAPGGGTVGATRAGVAPKWRWPTEHHAPPRPVPGGGILLFGKLGQDVCAAGSGRVVYTGSGIRGYGNLIIVKHADNMLSSYAHNSEMLVHEGQEVVIGQTIARMGIAAHQTSALYFEIRLNGKPVDPLRYLPRAE